MSAFLKLSRALLVIGFALPGAAAAQANAEFISQSVPAVMAPGQTYAVSVTLRNTGAWTWRTTSPYRLGSQNPENNTTWGASRVDLPHDILPGETHTFNFNVTAPVTTGSYNFQWRMVVDNGFGWFGPATPNVVVKNGLNDAQFVAQSIPSTMVPGQTYPVGVTMRNTGGAVWAASTGYRLGPENPQDNVTWGVWRIPPPTAVAAGQDVTFSFNAIAPTTPGVYNFQWKMLQEGVQWFGPLTPNATVAVGAVDHSEFVSQNVPTSMAASQAYAVSVTMKNAGGTTWNPGEHYLRVQNPQDNPNWGVTRVELQNAVAPGQNATFNFNVRPPVSGVINFRWQMARGTTNFGALTPNVAVGVSGTDNSQFVSYAVPAVMTAGQTYSVSVTMKNTGTNTWTEPHGYKLAPQNPQDNVTWGVWRRAPAAPVPPGQNATFTFNAIAPATPGTYNFQWSMVHEGVQWFGPLSTNLAIPVGTPNAAFVTHSVPTAMVQGLTYPVSVTMQNTGNLTWHPGQHYLRSQNAQDNTRWGPSRIELANPVPPGQSVTFNFNAAPASSGTLDFQWRMADGAVSFGSASTNVPVAVDMPQNAQFVSQLVPSAMAPGGIYLVRVTMRNTGSTTWSAAAGVKLGSQNPEDNTTWGSRVPLPHDVAPGEDVAFMFSVTAPSTTGAYNFQWKMLREGFAWFGASSTNVAVAVGPIQDRVHYIHADHLNTPRVITNASQQIVWRHDQAEPFGNNPPDENPSGLGAFEFPLRFPGQYFDRETNLHYNYYRDYDPSIGRYAESDPIGLLGGLNTYAYVDGNPLSWFDPDGNAKKYEKPPNPNRRKGAEKRQQSGSRERNVAHPKGEEHSRRPKGGFRIKSMCVPFMIWLMVEEYCRLNPGAMECLINEPPDPDDLYAGCPKDNPYCA